ncbi:CvpA family protein [Lapidilactobacillus achengensis]|uniref:CvpA family protein n=1 Tax=Lapidilactobacillus achengensis TaxID=2486000 RepID=A0ABW1UMU2_9LACO|nr:CvpA family protein [Lapidilactobacillus achengensis]
MILTIALITMLLSAWYRGYKRGLIKELLYSVGTLLVFLLALFYDKQLGSLLVKVATNYDLSNEMTAFIGQSVGFWVIMFVGHLVIRWIGRLSQSVTWLPVIKQANGLGGALLAGLMMYLGIFLALAILNVIQPEWYMNQYINSPVAQFVVEKTPIVSQKVIDWLFHTDTTSFITILGGKPLTLVRGGKPALANAS